MHRSEYGALELPDVDGVRMLTILDDVALGGGEPVANELTARRLKYADAGIGRVHVHVHGRSEQSREVGDQYSIEAAWVRDNEAKQAEIVDDVARHRAPAGIERVSKRLRSLVECSCWWETNDNVAPYPSRESSSRFDTDLAQRIASVRRAAFSSLIEGIDTVPAAVSQSRPRDFAAVSHTVNLRSLTADGPRTVSMARRRATLAS